MSTLLDATHMKVSTSEDKTLGEILSELDIERPGEYVIAVDGEITCDIDQRVSEGSRILVVPIVIGG